MLWLIKLRKVSSAIEYIFCLYVYFLDIHKQLRLFFRVHIYCAELQFVSLFIQCAILFEYAEPIVNL